MTPEKTAVVVVNFNSAELIERNLAQLVDGDPGLITVVVDNYSSNEALIQIKQLSSSHGWTLVESATNLGFGGGMNLGVEAAIKQGATSLVLINPDARLDRESLDSLVKQIAAEPLALISPTIRRSDGTTWFAGGALDLDRGRTISRPVSTEGRREVPWLSGACLATSAQAWETLGGFDDDYFLYWEDVDLSVRATRSGLRLEVSTDIFAVHDEGGTQTQNTNNDFSWDYYYFNIRNRLLFASKLLDEGDRRRWRRSSIGESYRILLRGGGKRKFLRPFAPLACGAKGLRDGFASRGGPWV